MKKKNEVTEFLDRLEDNEDVQNVFSNVNLGVIDAYNRN